MKEQKELSWINILFLTITPLLAVYIVPWYLINYDVSLSVLFITFLFFGAAGMGITMGYHRYFSHKAFEGNTFVKAVLLLFGAMAVQNSALKWCADHRRHHQFTDKEGDPYNAKKGFWWSHIGWIFYEGSGNLDNVKDLSSDVWFHFQNKYYVAISFLGNVGLLVLCGWISGDMLGVFVMAGLLRIVLNHHFTFFINSLAHIWGSKPYSDKDTSRDNFFLALVTYGEGYHNFHHRFPNDYRNGLRWWQFDPTKWTIRGLSYIGWTKSLVSTPQEVIVQAKISQQKDKIQSVWKRWSDWQNKQLIHYKVDEQMKGLSEQVRQIEKKLEDLIEGAKKIRKEIQAESAQKVRTAKEKSQKLKDQLKMTIDTYGQWAKLTRQVMAVSLTLPIKK